MSSIFKRELFTALKRRPLATLILAGAAGGLMLAPIFAHFLPVLVERFVSSQDLRTDWEICHLKINDGLDQCNWLRTQKLFLYPLALESNLLFARKTFKTPDWCKGNASPCDLVIGEVVDVVEVRLNGFIIGREGQNNYKRVVPVRPFPVKFNLPEDYLKNESLNQIELKLSATNGVYIGVSQPSIQILESGNATRVSGILTLANLTLPLITAFSLIVFALLATIVCTFPQFSNTLLSEFSRYCAVTSVFLISLTRVPRQFFDYKLMYCLHSLLGTFYFCAFLQLTCSLFNYRGRFRILIYIVIFFQTFLNLMAFFENFSLAFLYVLFKVFAITIGVIAWFGVFLSLKRYRKDKRVFGLLVLYVIHAALLTYDIAAVWVLVPQIFFTRFFPLVFATYIGCYIFYHHYGQAKAQAVAAEIGEIAASVAHDIRSPLSALKAIEATANFDPEQKKLFAHASARITEIAENLLAKYRGTKKTKQEKVRQDKEIIEAILNEKKAYFKSTHDIDWHLDIQASDKSVLSSHASEFQVVFSNLIDNAVESLTSKKGQIAIRAFYSEKQWICFISDNGKGIPKNVLSKIGQSVFTFGKKNGTGLGIYNARNTLLKWGGSLLIESQEGVGTTIQIVLPFLASK